MVKNTPAFVLKINPKGESSSVVHAFSRDFGKLILIAKGARSAKSPFKGLLEPFSLLNIHFNEKPGRPYQFLSGAEYSRSFRDLKQSTEAVLYGSVLLELIYKVQENSRDLEVFALLGKVLAALDEHYPAVYAHWYFIVQYLIAEGRPLNTERCYLCDKAFPPAYFHPFRGHLYCGACSTELAPLWELQAPVLSILKGLSGNGANAMPEVPAPLPDGERINRILWNTLAARFESCRTLKSVNVLRRIL